MEDSTDAILDLLKDILEKPKKVQDTKLQYGFDCPNCADIKGLDKGDNKGNLEINLNKFVYHCWSCGISGALGMLIDIYGNKKQKKIYDLLKPEEFKKPEVVRNILRLPEGFVRFEDSNHRFIPHIEAYKYLKTRGITDEMISKYNIGYTVNGDFAYRIIVPSYDKEGILNYFVARSWVPRKLKYKNPAVPKDEIIFNEGKIDWNKDVYLVEGVFDSFFLDNPIVMLGKRVSPLLFDKLYNNAQGNIIICVDGDAWADGIKLYHELNGGRLYNKIKIVKLPKDKDVCDLRGKIDEYYYEVR